MKRLILTLAATMLLTGCGDSAPPTQAGDTPGTKAAKPKNDSLQRQLISTVTAGDLKAVKQLLEKGASPDYALGTNQAPVALAATLIRPASGTPSHKNRFAVMAALCKHIRQRDRKMVELVGKVEVKMAWSSGGFSSRNYFKTGDTNSYELDLGEHETEFRNVPVNDMKCFLNFAGTYRVRGSLWKDKLEAEMIEFQTNANAKAGDSKATEGTVVLVMPLLSSSYDFFPQTSP